MKTRIERKFHVGTDEVVTEESALTIQKVTTIGLETIWEVEDQEKVVRASYPAVMTLEQVLPAITKDRSIVKMDWEVEETAPGSWFVRGKKIEIDPECNSIVKLGTEVDYSGVSKGIKLAGVPPSNMPESAQMSTLNIGLVTGGPEDFITTKVWKTHPTIVPEDFIDGVYGICIFVVRGKVKTTSSGGHSEVKEPGEALYHRITKEEIQAHLDNGTWNLDPGHWSMKFESDDGTPWAYLCAEIGSQPWKMNIVKLTAGEKYIFPSRKKNQWACLGTGAAMVGEETMPIWKLWYVEEGETTEFTATSDCNILTWSRDD